MRSPSDYYIFRATFNIWRLISACWGGWRNMSGCRGVQSTSRAAGTRTNDRQKGLNDQNSLQKSFCFRQIRIKKQKDSPISEDAVWESELLPTSKRICLPNGLKHKTCFLQAVASDRKHLIIKRLIYIRGCCLSKRLTADFEKELSNKKDRTPALALEKLLLPADKNQKTERPPYIRGCCLSKWSTANNE